MILACGPSGPELLLLLGVIFGVPAVSSIASVIGITAKRTRTAWIGATTGVLTAIPGVIYLCNTIGQSPDAMVMLLGGAPMGFAAIALIRCLCRQKEQAATESR